MNSHLPDAGTLNQVVSDQEAEIAELKAALKPLANLYDECLERKPDDFQQYGLNDNHITVGDIRRAVELTQVRG